MLARGKRALVIRRSWRDVVGSKPAKVGLLILGNRGGHGCPPHFAEYETPQNVSKDRVSLSLRPSVVPRTAQLRSSKSLISRDYC